MRRMPLTTSVKNTKKESPPAHQVKPNRAPDFLTLTGCKWKKTLVKTDSERSRSEVVYPCRNMDFQICPSVINLAKSNFGFFGASAISGFPYQKLRKELGSFHCPFSC